MNHSSTRVAALVLGDAAVLVALRPRWSFVADGLARPGRWLDVAGPDVAVAALCTALLWLAAAWIAVGLAAGLGSRLPGAVGRTCARCTQVVVPRVLLRVVIGTAGLGVLAAPAAQAAQAAPAGWTSAAHPTSSGVPSPTWPVTPSVQTPSASTSVAPPTWPASSTPTSTPTQLPASTPPCCKWPTWTATPPSTARPSTRSQVRRGDSLWLLAARRLGARADTTDITQYWPEIYRANRDVIGDDPSVIRPGQVLDLPAPTQESR